MKKLINMIAILCAVVLALPCLAAAEEDPVAYTVNGYGVTVSEIKDMAKLLYENDYTDTEDDYLTATQYVTYARVYAKLFDEFGLNVFTDEEMAAFETEADTSWEEALESYIAYFNTKENPTDEEMADLKAQAVDYFTVRGTTREAILENLVQSACYDRLDQYVIDTYGLAATNEDVLAALEDEVAVEKEYFAENVADYEIYSHYYGYTMYYTPAGYRGVLQILLGVDEELMNEYTAAQAAAEEDGADASEAEKRIEDARKAIMDSKQAVIDEIYARLDNGEKFIDLIPDYNTDPGMQDEEYLAKGYVVHRQSITYDAPFVAAAFDENMLQVGDVSQPQIGQFGIYIVYYLRDVPEGMVEVSDEEMEQIRESLTNSALNDKISNELYPAWEAECAFEYNEDVLATLGLTAADGRIAAVPAAEEEAAPEAEAAPAE